MNIVFIKIFFVGFMISESFLYREFSHSDTVRQCPLRGFAAF